ncbi:MAG: sigma-70 family RNA polymerase sigma factor [Planctomycetes bacterium]|nr:sigma-70 family RNA polymerase sigma factor [Planctomycetota bacterium]
MTKDPDPLDPNPEPANDLGETAYMVQQARAGDREAMNDLINRYKKPLERFMHARLSPAAHRVHDTQDGTQDVLIAAYSAVMSGRFQYRGLGSFWFYLRTSARNYIIKKNQRAGEKKMLELSEESGLAPAAAGEPPIASMIELEQMLQYERALETVPEDQRNAFLLFHEVGMSHANIAEECGFPSADAARMCIARVRAKVAIEMGRDDSKDARNKNSR